MKTVTIQIGNGDDKLRQIDWARFYADVNHEVSQYAHRVHFAAPSPSQAAWQNACWVIEISETNAEHLRKLLQELRDQFHQDSIAWTEGSTCFI